MRSGRVEERAADILAIWENCKDISLDELRRALAETGLIVSVAGLSTSSSQTNAPTTTALADMTQNDRKPL